MAASRSNVTFIPAQLDVLAATSTEAARTDPMRLFYQDFRTFFSMLRFLPTVFLPFWTTDPTNEFYVGGGNIGSLFVIILVTILTAILILLAIPALMILPGVIGLLIIGCGIGLIHLICLPIQGPPYCYSRMDDELKRTAQKWKHERWIFVNGCCVSGHALQMNCDRLAKTFGRPVTGIHNRTYGLVGDVVECLIQRAFGFYITETRLAYDHVKACLADPTVSKVVLIGHSQGGIIASQILDQLFADLPRNKIANLEVYTFGNAAGHFNNPLLTLDQTASPLGLPNPKRIIPYIEHYANSEDMVTRWGVLYNVRDVLDNRFSGQVFVHMGTSGHMLNQHYLAHMFPLPTGQDPSATEIVDMDNEKRPFLDQVVDIDYHTEHNRESNTQPLLLRRTQSSGLEWGDQRRTKFGEVEALEGRQNRISFVPSAEGPEAEHLHEAHGKTVRELSRLWRYMGGRDPDTVLSDGSETDRSEAGSGSSSLPMTKGSEGVNGNGAIRLKNPR